MTSRLPRSGGAATPAEVEQARQTLKDRDEAVALVRSSAAKWQAGLAGLLAVITGVSISAIGDTIERVGARTGTLLALLVLAAFFFAVCATFFALRASGGMPTIRKTSEPMSSHRSASAALNDLRAGVGFTMVALALFGLSAMVIWFAPEEKAVETVVQISGTADLCGVLDLESSPGFALITQDEHVVVIDLSEAPQWDVVEDCG